MSEPFHKLEIRRYPGKKVWNSNESKYWKKFKDVVVSRGSNPIAGMDFCQEKPDYVAVATSKSVKLYHISRGLFESDSKTHDTMFK